MPATRTIHTDEDWTKFLAFMGDMHPPYRITVMKGEGRSLDQNALLHLWLGEIATQSPDMNLIDIKGQCHRKYGLPIRLQDPQFAWVWERTGAKMNYEQQCAFLVSGVMNVSSGMTTKQLTEYLDAMEKDYRAKGFRLTDPKEMGE